MRSGLLNGFQIWAYLVHIHAYIRLHIATCRQNGYTQLQRILGC
jgi:hypothetical protein